MFLQKGAKKVIAVEGNEQWYNLLESNAKIIGGVVPVFMWLNEPSDISSLIKKHSPDTVKISTHPWSACENWLLEISPNIIIIASQYVLMSSQRPDQMLQLQILKKLFGSLNYNVSIEMHHVPIMTATRRRTKK